MGFLSNPDEHNVYMSWMRQAADGKFLFLDLFTTEPQRAGFFHIFFLALGLAARLTHLPLPIVYHAARVACGWLLLWAVYVFAARCGADERGRRLAFFLAAFSAGLGWLFYFMLPEGSPNPVDFGRGLIMPEAITFLTILMNPLFALSAALMVFCFIFCRDALEKNSWKAAVGAGVLALLLGNMHSYDLFPLGFGVALYAVGLMLLQRRVPWPGVLKLFAAALIASPSLAYQVYLFQANPVFREKASTATESPGLLWLALGLGFPLVGAALAIAQGAFSASRLSRLLPPAAWAVSSLVVADMMPVSFQRKMAEGVHVPICVLAALWASRFLPTSKGRRQVAAIAGIVLLTSISNIFFLARGFRDLVANNMAYRQNLMPPLYLTDGDKAAFNWLRRRCGGEAVLCANFVGSYLPGQTGCKVYIGHWAETLHFRRKVKNLMIFLNAETPDGWRRQLIREHRLGYLLFGPFERALATWKPEDSELAIPAFRSGEVSIYRLRP
jgi:hypothetical protein